MMAALALTAAVSSSVDAGGSEPSGPNMTFVDVGASEPSGKKMTMVPAAITVEVTDMSSHMTASICAMELPPIAQNIYYAVSPKVESDSNLRKLVEKDVRPKVLFRKLTIASAKENAEAAGMCLKMLKQQS